MHLQEFVTVLVRDPRIQKEDSWHSYIDYEIFIHVSTENMRTDSSGSYCCFCPSQGYVWDINGISASGMLEAIILFLTTRVQWNR